LHGKQKRDVSLSLVPIHLHLIDLILRFTKGNGFGNNIKLGK